MNGLIPRRRPFSPRCFLSHLIQNKAKATIQTSSSIVHPLKIKPEQKGKLGIAQSPRLRHSPPELASPILPVNKQSGDSSPPPPPPWGGSGVPHFLSRMQSILLRLSSFLHRGHAVPHPPATLPISSFFMASHWQGIVSPKPGSRGMEL